VINYRVVAMPMPEASSAGKIVRFGVFEVDLVSGELRKNGRKIHLQEQPFQVLALVEAKHVILAESSAIHGETEAEPLQISVKRRCLVMRHDHPRFIAVLQYRAI